MEPGLDMGLLDWDHLDRAVAAGRTATMQALERAAPEALSALALAAAPGHHREGDAG